MTTQLCLRAILGKLVELRPGIKDNVLASILTTMDSDEDKLDALAHAPADGDDIANGRDTAEDAIDRVLGEAIDLASPNDLEEAIRTALEGASLSYEDWQSIVGAIRENPV